MRKGLRNIILGTAVAAAGVATDFGFYGPIRYFTEQARLNTFAKAYKNHKLTQHKSQDNSTENLIAANEAYRDYKMARRLTFVSDAYKFCKDNNLLCIDGREGVLMAPIEKEGRTKNGTKIYFTRPSKFKHSFKAFTGYEAGVHATIFPDQDDGKLAIVIDLDSGSKNLEGTIAHEDQHVQDYYAGLNKKLPLEELEWRGHVAGLIADPDKLYFLREFVDHKGEDKFDSMTSDLAEGILKGMYRLRGAKNKEEFDKKMSQYDNPKAEISNTAQLLWNIKYGEKNEQNPL